MAADFEIYAYTANSGSTHPIRMSTASAAAQTTAAVPDAPVTSNISARVGASSRVRGLRPRGVRLKRSTGTGVNKKAFYTFLPILVAADWTALNFGSAVTVNGVAYTVSRKVPENVS